MNINQSNRAYYPYFDYLRAFCAIAVMLYHVQVLSWKHSGDLAVQIFFALSGWLIGGILIHTKPNELHRFYFNRAIRIWIPYYIALGLAIGLSIIRDPISEKWLEILIYKLTFVYNLFGTSQLAQYASQMPLKATLNHVWSVNAEEQFYLLAPLLLVIGSKFFGRKPMTWAALVILSFAINLYPAIFLGVFFATVAANKKNRLILESKIAKVGILIALLTAVTGLITSSFYNLAAPTFSICLVLLLAIPGKQSEIGEIIGGMSYPLYLNHWIGVYAINFLFPSLRGAFAGALTSSALNISIAICIYISIERRLLMRRDYWYSENRARGATLIAYLLLFFGLGYGYLHS